MKIVSTEGFVVSTTKYGENSKILNIITKDYGIIGVISRGCMSNKSILRTVSEKFVYANFNINYKANKLSTLINADVINYFKYIKSDINLVGYLTYLTELVDNVYKQNDSPEIYNIFVSTLLKIEQQLDPLVLTNILEVKFLDYLGIGLSLDGCAKCGNKNIVSISHKQGGFLCKNCYDNSGFTNKNALKTIRLYYYVDINKISELNITNDTKMEIDNFLNHYYKDYTGLYIKSKEFLNNLKRY